MYAQTLNARGHSAIMVQLASVLLKTEPVLVGPVLLKTCYVQDSNKTVREKVHEYLTR